MNIQRRRETNLPDDENAVWHGAPPDDRLCRKSLAANTGLDWDIPDFGTICRRQKTLAVNIPYHVSKGPLHLLITSHGLQANHCGAVDSTGIMAEGKGERNARKHPNRALLRNTLAGSGRHKTACLVQDPSRDRRANVGGSSC